MTINDGKTGGYPTLQKIYMDYLKTTCGENNQYTYTKMLSYAQDMGDYWIKIIEQMVPATTLWLSGTKVENSVFHRDKFVYRCFSLSGTVTESATTASLTATISGWTSYPYPLFRSAPPTVPFPAAMPTVGSRLYNNILTGTTTFNPLSTYANGYNINNRGAYFGSPLLDKKTKQLANKFHSNKNIYNLSEVFTKQGSKDSLLCVYGLKALLFGDINWIDNYKLGSPPIGTNNRPTGQPTPGIGGGTRITTSTPSSMGGGGY